MDEGGDRRTDEQGGRDGTDHRLTPLGTAGGYGTVQVVQGAVGGPQPLDGAVQHAAQRHLVRVRVVHIRVVPVRVVRPACRSTARRGTARRTTGNRGVPGRNTAGRSTPDRTSKGRTGNGGARVGPGPVSRSRARSRVSSGCRIHALGIHASGIHALGIHTLGVALGVGRGAAGVALALVPSVRRLLRIRLRSAVRPVVHNVVSSPVIVVPVFRPAHACASIVTRSAAMPLDPYAFTEPSDIPSVSATWASVMSEK